MTIRSSSRYLFPTAKGSQSPAFQFLKQHKINPGDLLFIGICLASLVYFTIHDPLLIATLGCSSIVFLSLWHITRAIPLVERYIGCKIRFWHIATAIITSTALCSVLDSPANAIFLSGLEEFMKELAEGASSAGGEAIDPEVIELIFNLIRGAFLLLVAAASLFAYNQAQQGNDWRPIVTQVALAFAIVIAIDVITFLFVGNGGGGGA
ncbi:hypothetical protein [Kamptonema sp. UHCC 0994]|uniref:hypothetical protein n=1 Tax=Kamptonema sp. UHCC 0994 TaxID=3031329 RepID=UPI0023B9013C|nr:hypothetical protein [Kamptonema sp. UHCC 0994]MDF0555656.1 hypothetical protein [Kamptonema sp. UHCC 0994]